MMSLEIERNCCVLLVALFTTACASTETLVSQPSVTLNSVELQKVGFRSQTFVLEFGVSNGNAFPLPVESVRYQILFDEEKFAGGETPASFSIPANGEGTFSLSVETDFLGSAAQITSLLSGGIPDYVEYELQGSLSVDIPFVKPLAFSNTGVIPIRKNSL
jgi:LEA14-like dessication related protein